MTEEQALLATILAHPADDLPRKVMADWYQEPGRSDADWSRGEFIRIQIELACRRTLMCNRCEKFHEGYAKFTKRCRGDICTLKRREYEVSKRYIAWDWLGGMISGLAGCVSSNDWSRGFVEAVRLPLAAFLGGECERCGGTGFPGGEPSHMMEHSPRLCRYCLATGRTEGIAKRLFESQPVLSIALSDREPGQYANTGEWYWVRWTEEVTYPMHTLPAEIFDRMAGESHTDQLGTVSKHYPSSDFAAAASSTVLVALARSLAALPPLRATPPAEAALPNGGRL